jgi:hypothetical protein
MLGILICISSEHSGRKPEYVSDCHKIWVLHLLIPFYLTEFLVKNKTTAIPHPPYLTDVPLCDFFLDLISPWFKQKRGTHLPSFKQCSSQNASDGCAIIGLAVQTPKETTLITLITSAFVIEKYSPETIWLHQKFMFRRVESSVLPFSKARGLQETPMTTVVTGQVFCTGTSFLSGS